MTTVGSRPEITGLSRVIPCLNEYGQHVLFHTGQTYEDELNGLFFGDLGLRAPEVDLCMVGRYWPRPSVSPLHASNTIHHLHVATQQAGEPTEGHRKAMAYVPTVWDTTGDMHWMVADSLPSWDGLRARLLVSHWNDQSVRWSDGTPMMMEKGTDGLVPLCDCLESNGS